jgi:hypothetical protein
VLVTMNLSRAAKKFRALVPAEPEAPKPAKEKSKKKAKTPPPPAPPPAPEPVVETSTPTEPIPEPVVEAPAEAAPPEPVPAAQSRKAWSAKAKRPRFVREKAERRERVSLPALPPRSTTAAARVLTRNLALPPKDDTPKPGR